jgi:hypothetical protein
VDHAPVTERNRHVGDAREIGIVGDQHERRAAIAVDREEEIDDLASGRAVEIPRRFVREQDRRIVRERALARARASRTPAISIGTSTFSNAVSEGSRWKNWNTMPTRTPLSRASASSSRRVMSTPSSRICPSDGASRPAIRPSSVDFPLPEGPVIATTRPRSMARSSG